MGMHEPAGRELTDVELAHHIGVAEMAIGIPPGFETLTRKEQEAWAVIHSRKPARTQRQAGEWLGVGSKAIERRVAGYRRKLGAPASWGTPKPGERAEKPAGTVGIGGGDEITSSSMERLASTRLWQVLQAMDTQKQADATLQQLGNTAKYLHDIRQTLRGEPTQIVRHEDRMQFDEAMGLLLAEARRRQLEIGFDETTGKPAVSQRQVGERSNGRIHEIEAKGWREEEQAKAHEAPEVREEVMG